MFPCFKLTLYETADFAKSAYKKFQSVSKLHDIWAQLEARSPL